MHVIIVFYKIQQPICTFMRTAPTTPPALFLYAFYYILILLNVL